MVESLLRYGFHFISCFVPWRPTQISFMEKKTAESWQWAAFCTEKHVLSRRLITIVMATAENLNFDALSIIVCGQEEGKGRTRRRNKRNARQQCCGAIWRLEATTQKVIFSSLACQTNISTGLSNSFLRKSSSLSSFFLSHSPLGLHLNIFHVCRFVFGSNRQSSDGGIHDMWITRWSLETCFSLAAADADDVRWAYKEANDIFTWQY